MDSDKTIGCLIITGVAVIIGLISVGMWGFPRYNVWNAGLSGEAELRRAEQNRQITIEEAKAKKESAQMLADAEVTRAKGVAEANRIIGDSLKDNESYLRYLWIDRIITGACKFGTEHFLQGVKDKKEKYTLTEVLKITRGQYGSSTFSGFFSKINN